MASPKQTDAVLLDALRAVALHGGINPASRATGIPQCTMRSRVTVAKAKGLTLTDAPTAATTPVVLIHALPPPVGAVVVPSGFDEAWRILAGQIGMAEDRYAGPSPRPKGTKHLVLSDLHAPFHDPALVAAAMAAHPDADTCIIAGDIGDGYGWSRFTKYEQVPYEDEIAAVTARGGEASSTCRVALMARNAPDVRDGEV